MKKILLLGTCALVVFSATAQDNEAMKKWMDYSTPGDMQALLAKSEGNWDIQISMWMAPGQEPMKATATSDVKMVLGGRYEQIDNKGSFNGMPYEGMGMIGYDNAKKLFQSSWIDNMGTGVTPMEGNYDAATKTLTLSGKMYEPMSGKDIDMRQTITFVDDTHETIDMYHDENGSSFKVMEMMLTKK